jgi:gamma-glutamyltranspeptidase/glutathione hydrolase
MNVQEAIDAPRFHQQWQPESTFAEKFAFSPDTERILREMGHTFGPRPMGRHVVAIMIGAPSVDGKPVEGKRFYGANDPRTNTGLAMGF